jgi:hypothetical protein
MDDTNTVKCPLCGVDVPIDKIDLPNLPASAVPIEEAPLIADRLANACTAKRHAWLQ